MTRTFNFDNVPEASEKGLTDPGTKAVFTITKVEFDTSKNGKDFGEVTFDEGQSSFWHRFYMSEGAVSRMQTLYKAALGVPLSGDVNEEQIKAALTNKRVALKVIGRVGTDGKGYPDLSFGGFAKPEAQLAELEYTPKELELIQAAKDATATYNAVQSDTETPQGAGTQPADAGAPQPTGGADDF